MLKIPYLTTDCIRNGQAVQFVPIEETGKVVLVEPEDTILIWDGSNAGEVFTGHQGVLASTMARIRSSIHLEAGYRYFFLKSMFQELNRRTTGATIPHVNRMVLENLPIALPGRDEQCAISTMLSKLQAAVDIQIRKVTSLQQLRTAAMHRLFHGASIADAHVRGGCELSASNWPIVRLGDVAHKISYGTSVRCEVAGSGRPVLRIPNVIGGRISESELKFAELPESHAERVALEEGDLLFVRTNGNREHMGRCAIYRGTPKGALFASYLLAVKLNRAVMMPDFVQAYLMAGGGSQIIANARPSADGKYNINSNTLRDIELPRPSLEEQARISRVCQTLTAGIEEAESKQKNLEALFQSALHDFISGHIRISPGFGI